MNEVQDAEPTVTVTVTRSAGEDGAVVVFIDTTFEPNARDGGPGLRVLVNDQDVLNRDNHGVDHLGGEDREAGARTLEVTLSEIAYSDDDDDEPENLCGLCGMRTAAAGHTACNSCA